MSASATTSAAQQPQPALPSISKQKSFIIENAGILNRETKLAILRIVMQEIGDDAVMENSGSKEVDINLDACATSNEDVVHHIYNMVKARLDTLNQPVGRSADSQRRDAIEAKNSVTQRQGSNPLPSVSTKNGKPPAAPPVRKASGVPAGSSAAAAATATATATAVGIPGADTKKMPVATK